MSIVQTRELQFEVPIDQAAAFSDELAALLERHQATVLEDTSRSLSTELREMGLKTQLNRDLVTAGIATIDQLCACTSEELAQLKSVRRVSIRHIILGLASLDPPRALSGREVIEYHDLVERLGGLLISTYEAAVAAGFRRLSQITSCDLVELERRLSSHISQLMYNLQDLGLSIQPLRPERTLAELRFGEYDRKRLMEAGINMDTRATDLSVAQLREAFEKTGFDDHHIDSIIGGLTGTYQHYGIALA